MTNQSPSVSVVIATRNRPELLKRAIDAVIDQDFDGQVDVLVVFDQTEPDTGLVHNTANRSVRVMNNVCTPGLPGGRNTGIGRVLGPTDQPEGPIGSEYIAFCDDDDMWLPGKLAAQIAYLQAHDDTVLCTTGIIIDFEGVDSPRPSQVDDLTVEALVHDRLTEAHPSSFLFRSSLIERIGLVDEVIPGGYSEDYDFLLRAAKAGRIHCIRQPYVSIRWGRTSYFANRWRMIVDAQRYLMAKHPEFEQHRKAEARIRGQIAFALAALGERRQAFGEIRKVITRWPLEKRWPVAAVVAAKVVSADRALEWAHKTGRGI
jgi:glycosyltransferase involved in cell wall biosynthesis